MKKIFTLLFIVLSANVFAQKGFYLQPVIGAGINKLTYRKGFGFGLERVPGFSYKAGIGIGYNFKRLGVETGLNYTSIAHGYNDLQFVGDIQPGGTPMLSTYDARGRFNYLVLSVYITYKLPITTALSVIPKVGFGFNYYLNGKAVYTPHVAGDRKIEDKIPHQVTSCSGTASVLLQYKLNNKLALVAGPAVNYIYTNVKQIFKHSYSNLLLLTIDAGITMKL